MRADRRLRRTRSAVRAENRIMPSKRSRDAVSVPSVDPPRRLLRELRTLIATARGRVARQVNEELVTLYWTVGKRVRSHILQGRRARYGDQIVYALSRQLTAEFGDGFSVKNLWNMVKFAATFDDGKIVHALRAQLSWTHLRRLIYVEDPLARDFYGEMCRIERWNTRTLDK